MDLEELNHMLSPSTRQLFYGVGEVISIKNVVSSCWSKRGTTTVNGVSAFNILLVSLKPTDAMVMKMLLSLTIEPKHEF